MANLVKMSEQEVRFSFLFKFQWKMIKFGTFDLFR